VQSIYLIKFSDYYWRDIIIFKKFRFELKHIDQNSILTWLADENVKYILKDVVNESLHCKKLNQKKIFLEMTIKSSSN